MNGQSRGNTNARTASAFPFKPLQGFRLFGGYTRGGATSRCARGCFPRADMLLPLRGSTPISVPSAQETWLVGPCTETGNGWSAVTYPEAAPRKLRMKFKLLLADDDSVATDLDHPNRFACFHEGTVRDDIDAASVKLGLPCGAQG